MLEVYRFQFLTRLPEMAISVVLLEKITKITCILYFKFVNIYFVKIIYMVQDVSKVLLKNFRITQLHVLCV